MPDATARRTPRERARAELMRDLLAAARVRLVEDGPHQLSLRAVARDLGLASSAVYRYVESRDALLTLLVVESYDAAGAAVEQAAARSVAAGHDPARTWLEAARGFRAWALADPHGFELVYGTPVPGYAAPTDTVAPALRLWGVVVQVLVAARRTGTLHPTGAPFPAAGVVTDAVHAFVAPADPDRPDDALLDPAPLDPALLDPAPLDPTLLDPADAPRCLALFTTLVGALTAELFGHLRGVTADPARAFDVVVATAAAGVGLRIDLADAWGEADPAR